MRCEQAAPALSELAGGSLAIDPEARHHIEHCLRCQAELVQYRRVLRALRALRGEVAAPAPGLLPELLAHLSEAGERRAARGLITGRRAAYLGGIAAATAAGAAGALVLATRSRRRVPLAG